MIVGADGRKGIVSVSCPINVIILTRDEERCIARCLDSVVDSGFDRILVVDTGSADRTLEIVKSYGQRGVDLVGVDWRGSFAEARNSALDLLDEGWVVFLDADEWLDSAAAEGIISRVAQLDGSQRCSRVALAPVIMDSNANTWVDQVPRVFQLKSGIRFRGDVHEYIVVGGASDESIELCSTDAKFFHDGYTREVVLKKRKTERNLSLLQQARIKDPQNPRWIYFTVRDALPLLSGEQLMLLCSELESAVVADVPTGDHCRPVEYLRRTLGLACQGLGFRGAWETVQKYCDRIRVLDGGDSADVQYFMVMEELAMGNVTDRTLNRAIAARKDGELLARSMLSPQGRHLDAAIAACIELRGWADEADHYRRLCHEWDDIFFERSRIRVPQSVVLHRGQTVQG
ncbi:glycosyltransferase family 2 protein [Amycolatopsis silviterrae]|uniref:Glycosyltransferase family 2 protein n=1 Tax=Amycolatopsis silviterrae TaxID=1656914 RepID=A0ABW5HFM6_9PSEU